MAAHADGLQELAGECGHPGGFQNGRGSYALFSKPKGLCYHPQGFLAVTDSQNACIRSVSLDGAQLSILMQPQNSIHISHAWYSSIRVHPPALASQMSDL